MKAKKQMKLYEWQNRAKQGGVCEVCGIQVSSLTVDHIVPIGILNLIDESGVAWSEDEDNFRLVCRPCNSFKGPNLEKKHPKTKEILLKYL